MWPGLVFRFGFVRWFTCRFRSGFVVGLGFIGRLWFWLVFWLIRWGWCAICWSFRSPIFIHFFFNRSLRRSIFILFFFRLIRWRRSWSRSI